jgi:hypothetical protein
MLTSYHCIQLFESLPVENKGSEAFGSFWKAQGFSGYSGERFAPAALKTALKQQNKMVLK